VGIRYTILTELCSNKYKYNFYIHNIKTIMYSQNYHRHKMSALRTMANNVTDLVERLTRLKDEMRSGYILQFFSAIKPVRCAS
jgi:hypothetical protein